MSIPVERGRYTKLVDDWPAPEELPQPGLRTHDCLVDAIRPATPAWPSSAPGRRG